MRQERVGWVSALEQAVTNMGQEAETPDLPHVMKRQPQTRRVTKERKLHDAVDTLWGQEWHRTKASCIFMCFQAAAYVKALCSHITAAPGK